MKQKIRSLLLFIMAIAMILGVAGCNAGAQNELQSKIDDLQNQIAQMEDRLAEMEDQIRDRDETIEDLNDQIRERDATIEDLNDQIKKKDEKIEELENELAEKSTGTFYTLQEAYVNGWLTKADLMSIAYYHNGGRAHNEGIMGEDYEPSPKIPEVLSQEIELKIKTTAAKDYREKYNIKYAEADGFTITQYCGTYNGCVAVMMRDDYSGTTGIVWTDSIAEVNIYYNSGKTIQIWRETK